MSAIAHHCQRCGGSLSFANNQYICLYCGNQVEIETAEKHTADLEKLFDKQKQEQIHNRRRILYDAVTAEYISREEVVHACDSLRLYLPDDPMAHFFKIAAGHDIRHLNRAIHELDADGDPDDVGMIITFLIKSINADNDYLLALNCLIERAYKQRDEKRFSRYATMLSQQAEKVMDGVYETSMKRDVFMMYSSKDMDEVNKLVEYLEESGMSCFVAARNLRHGIGSVENYERALEEAMDHCLSVVFVSSMNSRNWGCDALRHEMNYIKSQEVKTMPQYTSLYELIPMELKKPRVEYHLEVSTRSNPADVVVQEFFSGYERVYDPEGVATRLMQQIETRRMSIRANNPFGSGGGASRPDQAADKDKLLVSVGAGVSELRNDKAPTEVLELPERKPEPEPKSEPKPEPEPKSKGKPASKPESRPEPKPEPRPLPEVGKIIVFGAYQQGADREPIEWVVLDRREKERQVMLVSRYILDAKPYHQEPVLATWETCSLRMWLNEVFIGAAFKPTEVERIVSGVIKNADNSRYGTAGGNDTTDRIFCLSADEIKFCFESDEAVAACGTDYVKSQENFVVDHYTRNSWWWLRTPGEKSSNAANVNTDGSVNSKGLDMCYEFGGVRPAMWIDFD